MTSMTRIRTFLDGNPQLSRLYKNAGILFSGNVISAGLNLLALAVLTRALGVETFGLYALLTAYIALIDRLVSFQTWQAIIHYGSHALEQKKTGQVTSLLAFGWCLDAGSGLLGALCAIAGLMLVPGWFGLENIHTGLMVLASGTLLFNWVATPTAIMRLFNRFYLQALYQKITAGLRLSGFLALWVMDVHGIALYIVAWTLAGIAAKLWFFAAAWKTARASGLTDRNNINLKSLFTECPGLIRFVLTTNVDSIVRVLRDCDIFIVNALLGTGATAIYKIARELSRVLSQLTGPFYQAIYPELTRMSARGEMAGFRKLIRQSALTLGCIVGLGWLVFLVIGYPVVLLAFGPEYGAAYPVALWTLGAMVIWALAQPLSPALLALGQAQTSLFIHAVTSLAYMAMLCILAKTHGIYGAGIALFVFYGLWSAGSLAFLLAALKKQAKPS